MTLRHQSRRIPVRGGLSALALLALLFSTSCRSNDAREVRTNYPPIERSALGEMRNVSMIGSIWFGTMPGEEDLALAKRRGIRRVIDLSVSEELPCCDVPSACRALGLEYLTPVLQDGEFLTAESVDLVLEWIEESGDTPILMFDGSGGRCACYLAIWRVTRLGVPLEVALTEARRAGMKPGSPEDFVRSQVDRLSAPAPAIAKR